MIQGISIRRNSMAVVIKSKQAYWGNWLDYFFGRKFERILRVENVLGQNQVDRGMYQPVIFWSRPSDIIWAFSYV